MCCVKSSKEERNFKLGKSWKNDFSLLSSRYKSVSSKAERNISQATNPYVAKTTKRAHSDFGQPVLLNTVLCIEDAHHELYDVQNVKRLKLT